VLELRRIVQNDPLKNVTLPKPLKGNDIRSAFDLIGVKNLGIPPVIKDYASNLALADVAEKYEPAMKKFPLK